jgi:hypothetical protein
MKGMQDVLSNNLANSLPGNPAAGTGQRGRGRMLRHGAHVAIAFKLVLISVTGGSSSPLGLLFR